jgi:hypothetical protein
LRPQQPRLSCRNQFPQNVLLNSLRVIAHNIEFERALWRHVLIPRYDFPRDWRRTSGAEAIIARAFALSAAGPEMEEFRRFAPNSPGVRRELPVVTSDHSIATVVAP